MNDTNKTETTKVITKRAYFMLVNKVQRLEMKTTWFDEGTPEKAELVATLAPLRARLDKYSVDCTGEAHSNAFIDHCWSCAPQWGRCPNRELVK